MIQIKSDRLVSLMLVFGTRYALWTTANWNDHFGLIESAKLEALREEAMRFDFKKNDAGPPEEK